MDVNRKAALADLQKALGYRFTELAWLDLALTHRSVGGRDNERLEFLGDSVLGFVISEQLFTQFPHEDEGVLTRLRARLVRGQTLGEVGAELQLGNCILLGSGERKTGGQRRSSILANAFEAVLGAIFQDGGYHVVREVVLNVFEQRLQNLPPLDELKDAKTQLQEYLQGHGHNLPGYQLDNKTGPEHARIFTVSCEVKIKVKSQWQVTTASASASSRRHAEQLAAEDILKQLQPSTPNRD